MTLDRVREVEEHAVVQRTHTAAFVDDGLCVARGDVAGDQVAEARVLALQVVVALVLGDVDRTALVLVAGRHPDATVVAQRLAHQGELRLRLIRRWDAGRVDLGVARVGERRTLAVGPPDGRRVAGHGVGRQVVDVAVATGAQHHGVARVGLEFTGEQIAGGDADRPAVLDHHVEHLGAVVQGDRAEVDLAGERLVGAEQQLLTGLAPGVEGACHLGPAEGPVVEQAAVLACEGHTLGGALVDDVQRHLREAVDVGLAAAVVAALDRVVEEAEDAVAVVAVVLRRVDAALGRDRVRPSGGVVVGEDLDVVAHLPERRCGGRAGQAGTDHDDLELASVVGCNQLEVELVVVPFVL